jgi:serine phosphatase RsbU (regulator of sigma subunit)
MKNSSPLLLSLILISIIIGFSTLTVHSQNGVPYITFLDSREGYEINNWAVCQDDHHAMLFASRKGLLRFDGSDWHQINVPHIPHKIKQNPFNQKVYIISESNYGYLDRNELGIQFYEPLTMEGELSGRLTDILFTDTCVIFFGENSISYHSSTDHQLILRHTARESESFAGLLSVKQETYVNIPNHGLYAVTSDTLLLYESTSWDSNKEILFSIPHQKNQVLLGTSTNELLLFNGRNISEFKLSNPEYLIENGLSGGLILNDTIYAFSTSYGGVLLADRRTGKIIYTLNYDSGLPDDEIYAMGKDQNNGLWLTYGFGTCRVDMNLKVKDFSHYPGIEGLYTNAHWYQGELYVASTEGLFYLSEVKNFEEVEIYLKRTAEKPIEETTKRRRNRKEASTEPQEKKKFFSRLFNRNKNKTEETPEPKAGKNKAPATQVKYVRKKVSKLKSIEHLFKKVAGLNSRCEQLISTENGLLVGSSSGLYLIKEHEVKLLSNIRNVGYISEKNSAGMHYILCDEGVFSLTFNEDEYIISPLPLSLEDPLFSIIGIDSTLWLSGYDMVYKVQKEGPDSTLSKTYAFQSVFPEELRLDIIDDILYLFSESTIHYYAAEADSFMVYKSNKEVLHSYSNLTFFPPSANQHWLKLDQRMVRFDGDASEFQEEKWGLFENISTFYSHSGSEYWIIDDYSKIFLIGAAYSKDTSTVYEIFLESVHNEAGEYIDLSMLEFEPSEKMVSIQVSAPSFLRSQTTLYQYRVKEKMERWSAWTSNSSLDILIDPGEYTVLVRARNLVGQTSRPVTIVLSIRKPFYQSTWFFIGLIPLVLGFLWLLVYMRERKLRKDKRILEFKVEERTKEIQKQKQKIEIQKDEITAQKDDITSSITYASRIQRAILPSKQIFEKTFSDYFIFYKPRDIVSGDFYWVTERKGEIIFAVADCTGHGVPGAFMSMLGNSFLNEITKEAGANLSADQILNRLRDMINEALAQSGENVKAYDGMDISLCKYNIKKKEIEFSGAYNPLYLLRKGVFSEYKADRMPIGFHPKKKNFTSHTIQMEKGDAMYLFSDGFHDQFGGPFSKKYTTKQFKQILTALSPQPLDEQLNRLEIEMETWQGNNEQVDDVLIIGIRI